MKKVLGLAVILAVVGLFSLSANAQDAAGTLYDQEGTGNDGYAPIDATGTGPANPHWTNWKWQTGGGTWSAVYRQDGWLEESSTGDSTIDIECDIEMHYTEEFSNNEIYFHIGNIFTATPADLTAIVDGRFTSNNGMYIGTCFTGSEKSEPNMVQDGSGYTGEITGAMIGTFDVFHRDISHESFDLTMSLRWSDHSSGVWSAWARPVSYGDGASGTIHDTLWWLVDGGAKGDFDLEWQVVLDPASDQADGNYVFDPAIVAVPLL